jgi:hypothetical protein
MIFLLYQLLNHMQRRNFIHLSAYTAIALSLPFTGGCGYRRIDIESQPLFFSHITDAATIIATGMAYRKANKSEDDKTKLAALLLANNPDADNGAIRQMLDIKVKDDFKAGKIAVVKGWVLSVTEARQCALFSILQS